MKEEAKKIFENLDINRNIILNKENFSFYNSNPEKPEPQTNNNAELQTIKNTQKQVYYLPVIIRELNQKFCLLCHQNLHPHSFYKDEYLDKDNIIIYNSFLP